MTLADSNKVGKVTRADGRELRRLVAYLPPGVMSRMRFYCAEHGLSLSKLTAAALTSYLSVAEHVADIADDIE